jgi:hypothetical protein
MLQCWEIVTRTGALEHQAMNNLLWSRLLRIHLL